MIILMLPMSLALLLAASRPALADTSVTVNTVKDELDPGDHACSLREATAYASGGIADAECAPGRATGTTTIHVPAGNDYVLDGTPIFIDGNTVISGAGASGTRINAQQRSQVLIVSGSAHAVISGITITGGVTSALCVSQVCGSGLGKNGLPGGGIVNDGTLTLSGVTVTGNRTSPGGTDCAPSQFSCIGGSGGDGAGISNTGSLTIQASTIKANVTGGGSSGTDGGGDPLGPSPPRQGGASGNGGNGGGISNSGTLTISDTTISGNATGAGANGTRPGGVRSGFDGLPGTDGGTGGAGGAIENSGRLIITGSTLSGNSTGGGGNGGQGGDSCCNQFSRVGGTGGQGGAGGTGGAIDSTTETTISNSTLTGNTVGADGMSGPGGNPFGRTPAPAPPAGGGGIAQRAMGTTIAHTTLVSNTAPGAGGGVDGAGGSISVANSIVASNAAATGGNCAGVVTDQGANIEFGSSSCPSGFFHSDPKLGPLTDNGGPTPTIAILAGSSAIHHVRACVLATDQRGVGRPVGAACDTGAYQFAPPAVNGVSVTGATTTTADIGANVNSNLKATTVVVNFGRTAAYGSSTAPRQIAPAASGVPVAVPIAGLTPGTTYHFDVVATNGDGTTTTSDSVLRTLPPLAVSIASASTTGPTISLTIACAGGSGPGTCAGSVGLAARVSSRVRHGHKTRLVTRTISVARGSYSVGTGRRTRVNVTLNRAGQQLLTARYVLPTTLALRGPNAVARSITFRYPVIHALFTADWSFDSATTEANQLTVARVPHGARVRMSCHGGGCPFARRTFAVRRGGLALTPALRASRLRVGTVLEIDILAPNRVGEVAVLTIRSGARPSVALKCLPPGAGRPSRCVRA